MRFYHRTVKIIKTLCICSFVRFLRKREGNIGKNRVSDHTDSMLPTFQQRHEFLNISRLPNFRIKIFGDE